MSSHAGNSTTESCWRRSHGVLATTRCRCRVMLVTVLPSHAGDDVVMTTWLQYDEDVES
jgi:hypothetical protein